MLKSSLRQVSTKSNLLLLCLVKVCSPHSLASVCTHESLSYLNCDWAKKSMFYWWWACFRGACVLSCWWLWGHYSGGGVLLHALGHLQGQEGAILRHPAVHLLRLDTQTHSQKRNMCSGKKRWMISKNIIFNPTKYTYREVSTTLQNRAAKSVYTAQVQLLELKWIIFLWFCPNIWKSFAYSVKKVLFSKLHCSTYSTKV